MFRVIALGFVVVIAGTVGLHAQDPTNALLTAKKLDGSMVVRQLDKAGQELTKTPFEFRTADDPYRPLVSGRVFRAVDAVRIEYDTPNPFTLQISVSETQSEDPNSAQLAKFVEKLLTFPAAVGVTQTADSSECNLLQEVYRNLRDLHSALGAGSDMSARLEAWIKAVNDAPGRAGIVAAKQQIDTTVKQMQTGREKALVLLKYFETIADPSKKLGAAPSAVARLSQPAPAGFVRVSQATRVPATSGSGQRATPAANSAGAKSAEDAKKAEEAASKAKQDEAAKKALDDAAAKKAAEEAQLRACGSPAELARALATIIDLGSARDALKALDQRIEAVKGISKTLEPYVSTSRWTGNYYLIHVVTPGTEQIKSVTVSASEVKYDVSSTTGALTASASAAQSTKFDVRHSGAFVPELAAGMIVSRVLAPEYTTRTAAGGQLEVAPPIRKTVSYSGALTLNGVCRCGLTSSFAYPMFQVGVSTDGSSPGLLFGLGMRLTQPKRVALAGGVILSWIKDLNTLKEGSPVTGVADIKNDLTFRNVVKPYFGLQFKF